MTTDPGSVPPERPSGDDEWAHVHLLLEPGRNRQLLADLLGDKYDVTSGTEGDALDRTVDLCIVDEERFRHRTDAIEAYRDRSDTVFSPVLLIAPPGSDLCSDPGVWEYADDVIEAPVKKAELEARLSNLLRRRRTSTRLASRERELELTVAELRRKERAMDAAPIGITITDPGRPDNPLIYANDAFEQITGYDETELLGENMRLLQGPATDETAVRTLREAIADEERVATTLVNYRADGTRFWNRVAIAPVHDETGELVNFIGFQTDVTDEKVREQRLSVLNRVMRHNLSNDINVVAGYADMLVETAEDPAVAASAGEIQGSAEELQRLGRSVRHIERTLEWCRSFDDTIDLGEVLADLAERTRKTYAGVDVTVEVEDGPWYVNGGCLVDVLPELFENAVRHNDAVDPVVTVTVGPAPKTPGRVQVRIVDNGPGIDEDLVDVYREGEETPLHHGDGLGLWLVHWALTLLGGDVEITNGDGTTVTVTLPTTTEEDA
ncbi:PAS domain-containing protein [Haloarchaeobius amylolyticus]|uniref:PAS domain-containing protein n=1 Tax=Haloarchaeobius amylolyticus TaxID=1198296 RepID=UPI00226F6F83|nr:PAS domain-containing protein [Haloarchaeobius amylolyticus]